MRKRQTFLAVLLLWPVLAAAQPGPDYPPWPATVHMSYSGSALGFEVMKLEAAVSIGESGYHVGVAFRTVGLLSIFARSEMQTTVWGDWRGGTPAPWHFWASGLLRGAARETLIDYDNGWPTVRTLIPANDGEREEVPEPARGETIDTLSAVAFLIRRVADTGRCDGRVRVFDGRRLTEIGAHTVGQLVLADGEAGAYAGEGVRCDFTGRQLAGFLLDDSAWQHQPHDGAAWLARAVPGGPPVPVRLTFQARWVGEINLVLKSAGPGPLESAPLLREGPR